MDGYALPKDKGKAKEQTTHNDTLSDDAASVEPRRSAPIIAEPPANNSVLARLASSAASLSRSALSDPSSAAGLSSLGPGSKATSSSRDNNLHVHQEGGLPSLGQGPYTAFRAENGQAALEQEETFAEFIAAKQSIALVDETRQPDPEAMLRPPQSEGKAKDYLISRTRSVADQENLDGSEVVELLSQADFGLDIPVYEDGDLAITNQESSRLKEALFGAANEESTRSSEWDLLLDFYPTSAQGPDIASSHVDIRSLLGVEDLAGAQKIWLLQWDRVLRRYTDEVWGEEVGIIAKEALEESSSLRDDPGNEGFGQTKAIRRLRQILAHIRSG